MGPADNSVAMTAVARDWPQPDRDPGTADLGRPQEPQHWGKAPLTAPRPLLGLSEHQTTRTRYAPLS
jgi:hypothetical protein